MDSEGRIKVGETDITDILSCPVCKELPTGAIYQCKSGHILCHECYRRVRYCPSCRCRLPPQSSPIRNLQMQRLLNEVIQVECPFKGNGCGKKMSRNLADNHISGCSYNFAKFGQLVNLCQVLGYPSCTFQVNNGNTAVAIQHFQTQHGFHLTQSQKFQMELEHFKEAISFQAFSHFWTPVIVKLPGSQGHLLLAPVLNKDQDFAYLSIWFPDSSSYHQSSEIQTQVKYTVPRGEVSEPCKLVFLRRPVSISGAATLSLETLPQPFHSLFLKKHMRYEDKLRIICKIKEEEATISIKPELETFTCKIHPPLQKDSSSGGEKAKELLKEAEKLAKLDREKLWDFLRTLFEKPEGYTAEEISYLRDEALFLVLRQGTVAQLVYLKSKGSNLWYIFEGGGETTLHYVLKTEQDKKAGLEKVKVLVKFGVDFKHCTNFGKSLLDYAKLYGNAKTVKYVTEELKLGSS